MYRKSGLVTLIVFVLSFFFYPFVAAADIPGEAQNEWVKVDNSFKAMNRVEENYDTIKRAMETLNGQWKSNQENVAKGVNVTVSLTGGAIINAAVAVASGGSLAPAAFAAFLASKTAGETAATSFSSQQYLDAMSLVSGALSTALTDVQTTYSKYSSRYSNYIEEYAKHNLIRFGPNNTPSSVYTSVMLDSTVNTLDLDDGYYHASASSPSDFDHGISQKGYYKHWEKQPLGYGDIEWNTVALEAKYECKGDCTVKFDSPYSAWGSHRDKCGPDETASVEDIADLASLGSPDPLATYLQALQTALSLCTAATGCGWVYYTCDSDYLEKQELHKFRICLRLHTNKYGGVNNCQVPYRNCLPLKRDHDESDLIPLKSEHSDVAESNSPVASPTPTPTPTDGTPNCPDCTTHCSSPCSCTNSGTCNGAVTDGTPNCPDCTSDCSSPCSCTNSGTCGGSVVDNTPNCSDCTSHCSSPCSCTNSGTCNGSVYTPPSTPSTPPTPPPTPSTPTTVVCGGAAWTDCAESVSSRTEHKVESCSNCGNHYWTCMPGAVDRHTNVLTCKRSGCRMSLTRCQNGPDACTNERYHWF